jgi:hypothetical protein
LGIRGAVQAKNRPALLEDFLAFLLEQLGHLASRDFQGQSQGENSTD